MFQLQNELVRRGALQTGFPSVFSCARHIWRNEGAVAFWRGNFTNVIRYFPTQVNSFCGVRPLTGLAKACNFAFRGFFQELFARDPRQGPASVTNQFVRNVASGSGRKTIDCPFF